MATDGVGQSIVLRKDRIVLEGAALPPSLEVPGRNQPCSCGRGKKFKKCCWARTIRPAGHSLRMLIVGAGASIEECRQSGKKPDEPFPSVSNFGARLFEESYVLERVTASYLDAHGIDYDRAVLDVYESAKNSVAFPEGAFDRGPMRTFIRLEAADWTLHNVEKLFEHTWARIGGDSQAWDDAVYHGVYFYLFHAFTEQFGLGPALNLNAMKAGSAVAKSLFAGDRVISLNYDTAFDLALQQAGKFFSYSPNIAVDSVVVHKPHGSFNLYDCGELGRWGFCDPGQIIGSVSVHDLGGTWSPSSGILPPRLNKSYAQHPIAGQILEGIEKFQPSLVTFWGVGLTESDVDLLAIYRRVSTAASRIEFINPDAAAAARANELLDVEVRHYPQLSDWLVRT